MTTGNDDQGMVPGHEVQTEMNSLDAMCRGITEAWTALFDTHKDDAATRDIVALGLQHTAQLAGAVQTLALLAAQQPGPTGEYPEGELSEDDEGELQLRVHHAQGNVVIEFGKSITWLALPHDEVPQFLQIIADHAEAAKGGLDGEA